MFGILTKLYSLVISQQWKCFPFCLGVLFRDDGLSKETTDVILVANGGNHTCKPFKNRNLIFDAQVPVLGNSVFHHSFIKVAEVMYLNFRDTLITSLR